MMNMIILCVTIKDTPKSNTVYFQKAYLKLLRIFIIRDLTSNVFIAVTSFGTVWGLCITFFLIFILFYYFLIFCLLRAAFVAYGGSQTRGWIGTVAAGLHHSHSNARFKLCLRPAPHLIATLDTLPTEWGQGSNPCPHGY